MNGILDVIVALQWVQTNIESFGGDPASVTLIGESAGSLAISAIMVTPLAKGLFNRAIMMSGVSMGGWSPVSHKRAEAMANEYLAMMNATSFDEIKDQEMYPADVAYSYNLTRNPYPDQRLIYTWDPEFLPDAPKELYKDPVNFNVKEMIVGAVSFDGLLGIYPHGLWMPTFESDLMAGFGEDLAVRALEAFAYPDSEFATYVAIDGAYQVTCPTREFAFAAAKISEGSVYNYIFNHNHNFDFTILANQFQQPEFDYAGNGWTSHASELPLLFNHDPGTFVQGVPSFTEADYAVIAEFQSRFANFAKTGKPTYESGVEWSPAPLGDLGIASLEGGADAHTIPYLKFAGPNETTMIDGNDKTEACAIINSASKAADAAYDEADNAPPPDEPGPIITSAPKPAPATISPAPPTVSGSSSLGYGIFRCAMILMLLGI
jgi:para-nitrobenzyl esterase